MSAYGTIAAPTGSAAAAALTPLLYNLPDDSKQLAVIPLNSKRESIPEQLVQHLADLFNGIVKEGKTYPQEEQLSLQSFNEYFLAYDLFLGLLVKTEQPRDPNDTKGDVPTELPGDFFADYQKKLEAEEHTWSEVTAGCYYVKPNYPGRSSHCCNAGFIIDPKHRGLKLGKTLGRSYLHYAPLLGYKFSVFNLVYVTNLPSIAIWDSLGFVRSGLVPKAGRLKTGPNGDEEYVDAILYWRDFSVPVPEGFRITSSSSITGGSA